MVFKEREKANTSIDDKHTAGPDSTAPQGSTATQDTARGAGHNQEPQPTLQTAWWLGTLPNKETNAEARHQKTIPGNQTQQQTPEIRQQHQAPTSAQTAAEHGRGRHDRCTEHTTKKYSTSHRRWRHRATQHRTHGHRATTGDTATGDSKPQQNKQHNKEQPDTPRQDTPHHAQKQPRPTQNGKAKHRGKRHNTQQRATARDNTTAQ